MIRITHPLGQSIYFGLVEICINHLVIATDPQLLTGHVTFPRHFLDATFVAPFGEKNHRNSVPLRLTHKHLSYKHVFFYKVGAYCTI